MILEACTIGAKAVNNKTTRDHTNLCKIKTSSKYYYRINTSISCGTDCTRSASLAGCVRVGARTFSPP